MPDQSGEQGQQRVKGLYQNLLVKHGRQIFDLLRQDEAGRALGETPEQVFDALARFDPTAERQHKPYGYLNWLVKTLIDSHKPGREPITASSLPDIRYDLSVFHENKKRLPAGTDRDIFKYDAPKLCELVLELTGEDSYSVTALRRRQSQKMRAQSEILYEGPEGMIVHPLTIDASIHWGKGSKWCTAGTDAHKHFSNYDPLVIYMPSKVSPLEQKKGYSKFQGCGGKNRYKTFYHAQNAVVEGITQPLRELIDAAMREKPELTSYLQRNGSLPLIHIGEQHRNKESWLHEIIQNENKMMISNVPDEYWQDEQFAKAVIRDSDTLLYVPKEHLTPSIYLHALEQASSDDKPAIMSSLPREYWQDRAFRHGLSDLDPLAYKQCPKKLRDSYMGLKALTATGSEHGRKNIIAELPEKIWQEEAFRKSFSDLDWMLAFELCPKELCDQYLSGRAIEHSDPEEHEEILPAVPDAHWLDEEFFATALEKTWEAILYAQPSFINKERCLYALRSCDEDRDRVMQIIPEAYFTDSAFCHEASKLHWGLIKYCPEQIKDSNICLQALILSESFEKQEVLESIKPELWQDMSFCVAAYALTNKAAEFMPESMKRDLMDTSKRSLSDAFMEAIQERAMEDDDAALKLLMIAEEITNSRGADTDTNEGVGASNDNADTDVESDVSRGPDIRGTYI